MATNDNQWGSRLGFVLASAGAAVGLGAIWKFPYLAGTSGGSVFLLPYIVFTLTVGVSMLAAEYICGRYGKAGAIGSMVALGGKKFFPFGVIGVMSAFLILSFYSCVGGWCIKYFIDALTGSGLVADPSLLGKNFGGFVSNGVRSFGFQLLFLVINGLVLAQGIKGGIEKLSKYLMPLLFVLMLVIIVRGLMLPGAEKGLAFLFMPRWEDFTGQALLNAMGFTFFSLSLGGGCMLTYGCYLSKQTNIPTSTAWIAFLAVMSAILGGLMVMPSVFAFNLNPSAGPGLTFVTMPAIFAQLPAGSVFAVIFYACLIVAAITSSVSLAEVPVGVLVQHTKLSRKAATLVVTVAAAIFGLPCALSFGAWSDFKIFGKNVFDLFDFLTSNLGLLICEFSVAVLVGWVAWKKAKTELEASGPQPAWVEKALRFGIAILAPVLIIVVFVAGLL